jgi:hypothetical protein
MPLISGMEISMKITSGGFSFSDDRHLVTLLKYKAQSRANNWMIVDEK